MKVKHKTIEQAIQHARESLSTGLSVQIKTYEGRFWVDEFTCALHSDGSDITAFVTSDRLPDDIKTIALAMSEEE